MRKIIGFILMLISFSVSANISYTTIKNPEKVFIPQYTPVWCWAAMGQALFNYANPDLEPKRQEVIAANNPYSRDPVTHLDLYFIPLMLATSYPEGDYAMGEVMSSPSYQAKAKIFQGELVRERIDSNLPVILNMNAHVMMIYGYFSLGDKYFYLIYDPGAHFTFSPQTSMVAESNFFNWTSEPLALIFYLDKKQG